MDYARSCDENSVMTENDILKLITPIGLPSDEQIKERAEEGADITGAESYERGAKWIKEQILSQNK